MRLRDGLQTALNVVYPPRCLSCGDTVESNFGLCGPCWRDTPFIRGTVCESCGTPLPGEADGHRIECDDCMRSPRLWSDGRAALVYQGRARALVLGLKHGDRTDIARPAGHWMAQAAQPLLQGDMVVVPVPLHRTRLIARRYNQSALLAQALGRERGLAVCADALLRPKRTALLDGKTAQERTDLLRNRIRANPKRLKILKGKAVLLVDDVFTSGATFSACTEACLKVGAKRICVIALARVTKAT